MQVSEQIITVLDNLAQRFGVVIDWSQQNVLPYVQELAAKYIKWEMLTSSIWLCGGIALCVICLVLANKSIKVYKHHDTDTGEDIACFAFLLGVIAFVIIGTQTHDIIQCIVFPEFQLFGFVQGLLQ